MLKRTRQAIAGLFLASSLAVAYPVDAQIQVQDGLINVAIGDITVEDINIGVAAQIAANACGLKVGPVAVLGRAVDRSGQSEVLCTVEGGDVVLEQN